MKTLLMTALLAGVVGSFCLKAEVADGAYRFRGGERIRLIIPSTVGESVEQIISDDGFIAVPVAGAVNVKGKTIPEAQAVVTEALSQEAAAKQIFAAIALLEVPPQRVYVGGEVHTPQAIISPSDRRLSLAAAIISAGGATSEADLARVRLVRSLPGGQRQSMLVDASPMERGEDGQLGPVLQHGDVVLVPRGEVFILAGEVTTPGVYSRKDLSLGTGEPVRLSRLLFGGGGLKPAANWKDIRLIRTGKAGEKEISLINLDTGVSRAGLDSSPNGNDPILQDGDIVMAGSTGGVSILGRVTRPGVYPTSGETLKLTRLIALAGGFTPFAKTSSVTVVRAVSPNSPVRVDVNAITKNGAIEKDLELSEGDLVFVGERML